MTDPNLSQSAKELSRTSLINNNQKLNDFFESQPCSSHVVLQKVNGQWLMKQRSTSCHTASLTQHNTKQLRPRKILDSLVEDKDFSHSDNCSVYSASDLYARDSLTIENASIKSESKANRCYHVHRISKDDFSLDEKKSVSGHHTNTQSQESTNSGSVFGNSVSKVRPRVYYRVKSQGKHPNPQQSRKHNVSKDVNNNQDRNDNRLQLPAVTQGRSLTKEEQKYLKEIRYIESKILNPALLSVLYKQQSSLTSSQRGQNYTKFSAPKPIHARNALKIKVVSIPRKDLSRDPRDFHGSAIQTTRHVKRVDWEHFLLNMRE